MQQPTLARFLREERDAIAARFVEDVQRSELAPPTASPPLLVDHVPRFLDEIVAELEPPAGMRGDAVGASRTARQHGEQRWSLGYDLQALVREHGVLRHCIVAMAKAAGLLLSMDEFDVLARCLSVGVAEAVGEYVKHSEAQAGAKREQLEFLTEAGQLLSSSLDYRFTLSRLTGLIVPRLADWCSVHVQGVDVAEIPIAYIDPAKADVLRDMYRRFPLPSNALHGAPFTLRTGEPQLIARMTPALLESIAQSPEHAAIIAGLDFRSGMVVPLCVQGHTFGVLMMAYSASGRSYDVADLAFASELARRASIAIDNARLYELSQDERSRAEAAARAKDEFVAMLSHELRTPLNAMLGWRRLMRAGSVSESKRSHALEVIERNAEAQSRLVGDLLDMSRTITGKIRISVAQVDLGDLVGIATEAVRPAADAKGIRIELDVDRSGTSMRGDGDRLRQVAASLLTNAVKFTPKGGVVRVGVRRVESDLALTVEDSGAGIAPAFLPHVFESFRQADGSASRAHGGLGIGLSISKHIVELHGGTIRAESNGEGRGAVFQVRLPISPVVSIATGSPPVPATLNRDRSPAPPTGTRGARVLVVDDEPDARELVAFVFEDAGMAVRTAASAAEALAALESFTPDVVASDIGMPLEDGYALIRSIRTLPSSEKKNVPAIALTAFARNEDRTRALVAGFNLRMAKPVEPAALVEAVTALARTSLRGEKPPPS